LARIVKAKLKIKISEQSFRHECIVILSPAKFFEPASAGDITVAHDVSRGNDAENDRQALVEGGIKRDTQSQDQFMSPAHEGFD
jgi:hypothetical protein